MNAQMQSVSRCVDLRSVPEQEKELMFTEPDLAELPWQASRGGILEAVLCSRVLAVNESLKNDCR